jgi:signal peptidase I
LAWLFVLIWVSAGATLAGVVGYARRRLLIVTVEGRSMEPTLHEGDRLLVRRCSVRRLRRHDVVVLDPPEVREADGETWWEPGRARQVKRVAALPGQPMPTGIRSSSSVVLAGTVVVLSDNAAVGIDSRRWGPYPANGVVGVVMRRMRCDILPRQRP